MTISVSVKDLARINLMLSANYITVLEGESGTVTLTLSRAPSGPVAVAFSTISSTPGITISPSSVNFTTSDWNTAQTVTITATENTTIGQNFSEAILFTSSGGGYDGIAVRRLDVDIPDDDQGVDLVISNNNLTIDEGGSGTFDVRLTTAPTGTVTVAVSKDTDDPVTFSPSSLSFTTSTWNDNQTVTVTANQDDDYNDEDATITLTPSGGGYAGTTHEVDVTINDDEDAPDLNIVVSPESPVSWNEYDGNGYIDVSLRTEPTANVTVAITGHSGTDIGLTTTSLTFTPTNYRDWQRVNPSIAQDADQTDDVVTLTFTGTSTDADYNGTTTEYVITIVDDDAGGLETLVNNAPASEVEVVEGESASFTLRLTKAPTGNVTVTITGQPTGVTVTPASLTFTTDTWAFFQTITITAPTDSNTEDEDFDLTLTATGGGYTGGVNVAPLGAVQAND